MDNSKYLTKSNDLIEVPTTDDILTDLKNIIDLSQEKAYQIINTTLIYRNWLIGYRIFEGELQGDDRADYGSNIIKQLSSNLTNQYGKGYTKTNLYSFYSFYKMSPNIFHTVCGKSISLLS